MHLAAASSRSSVQVGLPLVIGLVILLSIAIGASIHGELDIGRRHRAAAGAATVQLIVVSAIIAFALGTVWAAFGFAGLMFATATFTASGRIGARPDWRWVAAALAVGVVPVLVVVFGVGVAPLAGPAIIPIAGIMIGGSMTSHALAVRRAFDSLRNGIGTLEAGLALGMTREQAIDNVIAPHASEALVPILDQTRTVGLVTLPGAFIGVVLAGGSAGEAAAAQLVVLVGLLAVETSVVVASHRLVSKGRILPADLRALIPDL